MRTALAMRLGAHACIFLAAASISPVFTGAYYLPFVCAALILAADLAAVNIENRPARIAVAMLPAVVLIFSKGVYSAVVLAAPIVYSAAVIGVGRFSSELWQLKGEAKTLLLVSLVLFAFSMLGGYTTLFAEEYPLTPIYCSWGLLFTAVLLVFLMLRTARIGAIRSPEWHKQNLLWFFIPLAAAIPLGAFGLYVFIPFMKFAIFIICAPIVLLMYLGSLFFSLFYSEDMIDEGDPVYPTPTAEHEYQPAHQIHSGSGKEFEFFRKMTKVDIPKETILTIGLIVLILALALAAFLLIRRSRRMAGEHDFEGGMEDLDEELIRGKRQRRMGKRGPGNAERVRFTYRQYLAFLRIHGIVPSKSNTSFDISEEASRLLRETDELLRGLYRKARYGRESNVTEAEAELAAETYLRLVNDKNIKNAAEQNNDSI